LSTAFDSGWNSSVGGRHLLVNGYANGWLVDRKGDYVLFLDYLPQKQFTIGLSVFIGMIIFSLIYLGVMTIGRRK